MRFFFSETRTCCIIFSCFLCIYDRQKKGCRFYLTDSTDAIFPVQVKYSSKTHVNTVRVWTNLQKHWNVLNVEEKLQGFISLSFIHPFFFLDNFIFFCVSIIRWSVYWLKINLHWKHSLVSGIIGGTNKCYVLRLYCWVSWQRLTDIF